MAYELGEWVLSQFMNKLMTQT